MSVNAISSAFKEGIFEENASQNCGWANLRPRIESMLETVDNRTTLFLGAAASSFKPTAFPAWAKFIELLYISLIDVASEKLEHDRIEVRNELKQCIAGALQWNNPDRVPYYKVTEVIARRLGKDYLRLLNAFGTPRSDDGWLVNGAHRWAAKCLMDGSAAAVVTPNFDDCIESALKEAQANVYRLTGNCHVDGPEIIKRMGNSTQRLVLVVSGPKPCQFAQAWLPRLGKLVSLLFKLHGSCYEPETCIDTRLQRQQGLPSYAVDILDTLLVGSVFFLACYSGGDLDENTDYLRMIHNKEAARLVWLQRRVDEVELGVKALSDVLQTADTADHGLCLLHGSMRGEQVEWDAEPSEFANHVLKWSNSLGPSWCKLVVLDLIELCDGASVQGPMLEKLGFSGSRRQDWNSVLEQELGQFREQDQFIAARNCSQAAELLHTILADELNENQRASISPEVKQQCSTIKDLHQSFNNNLNNQQPHAQSWVLSSLYGLLLLCSKQQRAAREALAFAQNSAYLVGDLQAYKLIKNLIGDPDIWSRAKSEEQPTGQKREDSALTAFIPSLDNVNAKANLYGAPPSLFFRALLHRAILFADRIAIPPQVLTNSKEFVGEVLFGGADEANDFYLSFLCPIVPQTEDQDEAKSLLSSYRRNTAASFISEGIMESHVKKLEEYFHSADNENRFLFYSRAAIEEKYNQYIYRAVSDQKNSTKKHLMDHWRHIHSQDSVPENSEHADEDLSAGIADTIIMVVKLFIENVTKPITRSMLYLLSGLFVRVVDDHEAFKDLRKNVDPAISLSLTSGRAKLLERPWITGPLCHELFDVPYECNLPAHFSTSSTSHSNAMFIEEHEMASWRFMAELSAGDSAFEINDDAVSPEPHATLSALLLGQAPKPDLTEARNALSEVREKLAANEPLDAASRGLIARELATFKKATVNVDSEPITELAVIPEQPRAALKKFLRHCIFLARKGAALDRMYEEPVFSLPGVLRLQRREQSGSKL